MNDLKIGDKVKVTGGEDTEYKVVHVKPQPGADGYLYLCESTDGVRIARYEKQLTKAE